MSIEIPFLYAVENFDWPSFAEPKPETHKKKQDDLNLDFLNPEYYRARIVDLSRAYVKKDRLGLQEMQPIKDLIDTIVRFASQLTQSTDLANFIRGNHSELFKDILSVKDVTKDWFERYIREIQGHSPKHVRCESGDYWIKLNPTVLYHDGVALELRDGPLRMSDIHSPEYSAKQRRVTTKESDLTLEFNIYPKGKDSYKDCLGKFHVTYTPEEKVPKLSYISLNFSECGETRIEFIPESEDPAYAACVARYGYDGEGFDDVIRVDTSVKDLG